MIIKFLVIIAFIMILVSLGSALFYLIKPKDEENSKKTLSALTVRISLSIILFIFVFIAIASGWYQPTGMITRIHPPVSSTN
jgi:O-antigen/teichoic acid export membrane protein